MNILDYVDFRGDILFSERGFNEVDNLVFSELSYVEMDDLVTDDGSVSLTVSELRDEYSKVREGIDYAFSDPWPLLDKCADSARFGSCIVKYYKKILDQEDHAQFAAVTFIYGDSELYIAFRGTDGSLEGWREGFNFSFREETRGQHLAVEYLEQVAELEKGSIIAGGHSKGGNFAEYAAAFCKEEVRQRVVKIFSNDGPGFNEGILESEGYKAILERTLKLRPEDSFVGGLLLGDEEIKVIKGTLKGILQHDPFNWSVRGTEFEPSDKDPESSFAHRTMAGWLENMEPEEKHRFTDAVFETLESSGISSLSDLRRKSLRSISAIRKAQTRLEPEKREEVREGFRRMRKSARENLIRGKRQKHD